MRYRLLKLLPLVLPPLVGIIASVTFLWWLFRQEFAPIEPVNHFVNSPPPPERNPNIPSKRINLQVWLDLGFTQNVTLFEEMALEFEQVYPNINVEISSFVRESMPRRIRNAVLAGAPPDVAQGHVFSLAGQGLAEPLDHRMAAWNPDLLDEFLPYALEEAQWHDTLYGIPVDVYTVMLLYNQNHFDEAGLAYPTSDYELLDLLEAAEQLSKPDEGRYGIGLTTDAWYFHAWLTSAGTDMVTGSTEEGFQLTLNAQNNVDVLTFLVDMIDKNYSPRPSSRPRDYEEARELFLNGRLSIYFGEPQDIHHMQLNPPDFPLGVAPLPRTPAKDSAASVLGTTALFIPRNSRNQEAAFEFIKWAASDRYVDHMARRLGRYPARKWLLTSPQLTENLLIAPFFNQLELARPYRLDLFLEAEEEFVDAVRATFHHVDEPQSALRKAQISGQLSTREALRWSPQPQN